MSNVRNDIFEFMKASGIMTLSCSSLDGKPWCCTLYYGMDDDFNLYVFSDPESEHGKIIKSNPNVAFNIFDSRTKITEDNKGVQGKGTCSMVGNPVLLAKGLSLWHKANPGIEKKITIDDLIKVADTRLYRIKPSYIKFFNKVLYGKRKFESIEL